MKNARNQHRTDYAKELVKIVQTTKDREELKKKIAAYHERDIANAIVESDKTVRKCIYDILDIAEIAEIFSYIEEEPGKYLEEMPIEQAAKVVSNMDSDDAMDLFEELNEEDKYKLLIGDRTAEEIKIHVGSALSELDEPPADFVVQGPNQMTSLPVEVPVSYQEIAHCIEKSISKIEIAILAALEQTPPELYADIVNKGIYLAGGGALLRGLDKRLTDKLNIPFHIAEDPLRAVARGTGIALKNVDRFSFLIR